MNILVTGGTGFIGKYLIRRLLNDKHTVLALVRDLKKGELLKKQGARILEGNLSDSETCFKAVQGVEVVYHLAALTGFWGISWDRFYETNVLGTLNILNACLKEQCPNVVHVSTTLVYGPRRNGRLLSETDPEGEKLFDYERTKLESEKIALHCAKEKGLNVKIARLTSVYGPEGRFIQSLVEGLLQNKLKIIGNGDNKKHITHVLDCVEGIILSAQKGKAGALYNIGASDIPTMGEIIKKISQELGVATPKKIPLPAAKAVASAMEFVSLFTKKPPHLTRYMVDYLSLNHSYDIRLAKEDLGFVPWFSFEEGITAAVRGYLRSKNQQ